ncbi:MAG: hypothetical protein BroJett011_62420 [Chloroflexota bacterium]|nr:MAG: hypothetical protein BroJett011_62420 [Chloroflexota bacterium]
MKSQVVLINTLADFMAEVPFPGPVRLNLTKRRDARTFGSGRIKHQIPTLHVQLDLQGVNERGEIVWLHESHELQKTPGGGEFWGPTDKSLYGQMPRLQEIVKAHLESRGYQVRGGQYGLPKTVQPVRGVFECARWEKIGERELRVSAEVALRESQDAAP